MNSLFITDLPAQLSDQLKRYPQPTQVNFINSYITEEGLNNVWPFFQDLEAQGTEVRLISTFHRGITDPESIEKLARLQNFKVDIYWPEVPNFHPKCWLFHYEDGNGDALIIGSSNLTLGGTTSTIETNAILRRDQLSADSTIIEEYQASFDNFCDDPDFNFALIKWDVESEEYPNLKAVAKQYCRESKRKGPMRPAKTTQQVKSRAESLCIHEAEVERIEKAMKDRESGKGQPEWDYNYLKQFTRPHRVKSMGYRGTLFKKFPVYIIDPLILKNADLSEEITEKLQGWSNLDPSYGAVDIPSTDTTAGRPKDSSDSADDIGPIHTDLDQEPSTSDFGRIPRTKYPDPDSPTQNEQYYAFP